MKPRARVLLVRLSSLGDVVLATAAVEALREDLPEAEVHVLTKPAFREVFANNPGVHGILPWEPGEGILALARRIRDGGYDRVVDLHRNLRTTALRALTPGVRWDGYRKGAWRRRTAVWLRRPELLPRDHVVDRYIAALRALGVTSRRRLPKVYPSKEDRSRAGELLRSAGCHGQFPVVALAPGARWPTKAWPEERWRSLVAKLKGRVFPVLLGASVEREGCERVLQGNAGANLAGQTSILETAAALERASVLVSNDSAPLHLAAAVRTPVVALFGPTVRGFGFPPVGERDQVAERSLPCRPCSLHGSDRCKFGHHHCLVGIAPEDVEEMIRPFLDRDSAVCESPGSWNDAR